MGRGRGGSRGGGRGGRGGKRGGGDAASSGDVYSGGDATGKKTASSKRGGKRGAAVEVDVDDETMMVSASQKRAARHEDMYDEVDDFMDNRHKIALDKNKDDEDDSEGEDDGVNHPRGQSFELEGLEPEEDEDEDDEEEETAPAKTNKRSTDYDDIEADEAEEADRREREREANMDKSWGKKKGVFYGADADEEFELLQSDEEDAAEDELKESQRLQRDQMEQVEEEVDDANDMLGMIAEAEEEQQSKNDKASSKKKGKKTKGDSTDAELLKAMDEDLDVEMAFNLDLDLDLDKSKQSSAAMKKSITKQSVLIEKITKDVSSLSDTDKLEVLLTSSPELLSLLDDFKKYMTELRQLMPEYESMKENEEETNTTQFCYIALKVETLLMYCCHLSFYISLKAAGHKNTQQHSIMKTLLHLKQTLQSLEPIQQHFEQLATLHQDEDGESIDDNDEEEEGEEAEADDDQIEADENEDMDMDGLEDDEMGEDEDGEDMGDFSDGEDAAPLDPSDLAHSDLMARQAAQLDRLLAAGIKPASSKSKKKSATAVNGRTSTVRAALADFGEVDHRAEMAKNITIGGASGKLAALQAKLTQANQAQLKQEATKNKKKRSAPADDSDGDIDDGTDKSSKRPKLSPTEVYEQLKEKKQLAKEERKKAFTPGPVQPLTLPQLGDNDKRKVSGQIDHNRGLVRSRDKQHKTPKTRNRKRYDNRLKARNGQVQLFKESQAGNYGGQATGIKTNVTKSVRLA